MIVVAAEEDAASVVINRMFTASGCRRVIPEKANTSTTASGNTISRQRGDEVSAACADDLPKFHAAEQHPGEHHGERRDHAGHGVYRGLNDGGETEAR